MSLNAPILSHFPKTNTNAAVRCGNVQAQNNQVDIAVRCERGQAGVGGCGKVSR